MVDSDSIDNFVFLLWNEGAWYRGQADKKIVNWILVEINEIWFCEMFIGFLSLQNYRPKWQKCVTLHESQTNITTIDEYAKFDFHPKWMNTKEFWDESLQKRYEQFRANKTKPNLKVWISTYWSVVRIFYDMIVNGGDKNTRWISLVPFTDHINNFNDDNLLAINGLEQSNWLNSWQPCRTYFIFARHYPIRLSFLVFIILPFLIHTLH